MSASETPWWRRYVPGHVSNPFGLAKRLLTEEKPAARSALLMAAGGLLLTPVDLLLRPVEQRLYRRARRSTHPLLLVVGPPRSGTTLVAQYLINTLEVAYVNNLTSLMPRSPITVNRMFRRWVEARPGDYQAYYGKSRGLAGANDGLYIWDRWLGSDRRQVPTALEPESGARMRAFFGAFDALHDKPVVTKVNRLNTCASLIAAELDNVSFVCLQRSPLALAQSLYIARTDINGNLGSAYGVHHDKPVPDDPVEDVCRQVVFHERQAQRQRDILGEARFRIIAYEDFCQRPHRLSKLLVDEHPELGYRSSKPSPDVTFTVSNKRRLPEAIYCRMRERLRELDAGNVSCRRL